MVEPPGVYWVTGSVQWQSALLRHAPRLYCIWMIATDNDVLAISRATETNAGAMLAIS